ncbi:TatD family hydrolase [Candidatus Gracilibacteria bacterium]|nr:TatD family hydrolase [Candidatus Gracilibacteria bacterium]
MYDSHAHLEILAQRLGMIEDIKDNDFGKLDIEQKQQIKEKVKGVGEFIVNHDFLIQPSVSTENFKLVYYLFNQLTNVSFLAGSHPEIVTKEFEVEGYLNDQKKVLEEYSGKFVGIGECGLDYYYTQDHEIITKQKELFRSQIELAVELDLPLIIHCRDAFEDLFEILRSYPSIWGKFLIHCFTGSVDEVKEILQMKGYFGIGGVCTFKSASYLREAISQIPVENIFMETDLPFLSPTPYRGEVCMPQYIGFSADVLAKIKNIPTLELWEQTQKKAKEFFNLSID